MPHTFGDMSVAQVIQRSSNVGAARIALGLPAEAMWGMFDKVGFGSAPRLGFPGEVGGKLRAYKHLEADRAGHHGLRSRHLGVAAAAGARLHHFCTRRRVDALVAASGSTAPLAGKQVISPDTARKLRAMLEMAVELGGTAPSARVHGLSRGRQDRNRAQGRKTAATPRTSTCLPSSASRRPPIRGW